MGSKMTPSFMSEGGPQNPIPHGRELKKLRHILQEREGTSLNYFKVFSKDIEQLSRSISVCLGLYRSILVYLGLSGTIWD